MFVATNTSASVASSVGGMPEHMKFSESKDERTCWEAYQKFMDFGDVSTLPMIFTKEGSQVGGRSGSPLCYNRLFGLKEPTKEIGKDRVDPANDKIRKMRIGFREKLLEIAQAGGDDQRIAQKYVREAYSKHYPGFQKSEIEDEAAFEAMLASWPVEEVGEEAKLKDLINKGKLAEMVPIALRLADEGSNYAQTVVLQGIFEGMYGGKFIKFQSQALELLEKYALLGSREAFKIMQQKINIPQVKVIASKPEVIAAANRAKIDDVVGGWESFLRAKGVIAD